MELIFLAIVGALAVGMVILALIMAQARARAARDTAVRQARDAWRQNDELRRQHEELKERVEQETRRAYERWRRELETAPAGDAAGSAPDGGPERAATDEAPEEHPPALDEAPEEATPAVDEALEEATPAPGAPPHLAPLMGSFAYDPGDTRFVGGPVELLVFDGLSSGDLREIVLVAVRSGSAGASPSDGVREGRVSWREIRLGEEPTPLDVPGTIPLRVEMGKGRLREGYTSGRLSVLYEVLERLHGEEMQAGRASARETVAALSNRELQERIDEVLSGSVSLDGPGARRLAEASAWFAELEERARRRSGPLAD